MKARHFIYLILPCIALITSCGDDESTPEKDNDNVNANIVSSTQREVHDACLRESWKDVARRLEVPRLTDEDLFVIHATKTEGLNYTIGYDTQKRAARWCAYAWHAGNSYKGWSRKQWESTSWEGDPFQEDPLIPAPYRSTLADHKSNGYDRGHMVASEDRICSKEFNEQTFYLSNMHPQLAEFNQKSVWYNLEERLRETYNVASFRDTLYVVKGGTIRNDQLLETKKGLPVPKYFFMAILCKNKQASQGGYKAIAFWMPHTRDLSDATNYKKFAVSIDRLEQLTGIDFFCNLPGAVEKAVEATCSPTTWGL